MLHRRALQTPIRRNETTIAAREIQIPAQASKEQRIQISGVFGLTCQGVAFFVAAVAASPFTFCQFLPASGFNAAALSARRGVKRRGVVKFTAAQAA